MEITKEALLHVPGRAIDRRFAIARELAERRAPRGFVGVRDDRATRLCLGPLAVGEREGISATTVDVDGNCMTAGGGGRSEIST